MAKLTNKVFKEKTSIKQELQKALDNNITVTPSYLAKQVGISVYRVRKYCKTHAIDLSNYTAQAINNPIVIEKTTKKKTKKMVVLNVPQNNKISLGAPKDIKVKLD